MKPKYKIGQRVIVKSSNQSGVIQTLILSGQNTFVYKLKFPGGAEYSYGEWELIPKAKP